MREHRAGGFSLVEVMVMLAVLLIVTTASLTMASAGVRFATETNHRQLAQSNVRLALAVVSSEVRQAIPDPDPGGTGYRSIVPVVPPTGVLAPNVNSPSGKTLEFTQPDTAWYEPLSPGWDPSAPCNYRRVKYYLEPSSAAPARELRRQEVRFDSSGGESGRTDAVLIHSSPAGTVDFVVTSVAADTVRFTVTAVEGRYSFSHAATVIMPGK